MIALVIISGVVALSATLAVAIVFGGPQPPPPLASIYEGCLRQHMKKWDRFEDLEAYGILREEWAAQTSLS